MLLNAYCTRRELPALTFTHTFRGHRDRSDPELREHLHGFMGFVMGGGERPMTETRYHVLRHLERVRHHVAVEVESSEMKVFEAWAREANAIVFLADGSVRTPSGTVLVDPESGDAEPGASAPFPADAEARKTATQAKLAELGVDVPPHLPPVVSEVEVELRAGSEVASRCLALFACAIRAESLAAGQEIATSEIERRIPLAGAAMSPKERASFAAGELGRQDLANAVWRYEALTLLLWAVGRLGELPLPTAPCDVASLAKTMVSLDLEAFVRDARLRPTSELLDALDLHVRLHWATTDARVRGTTPPAGLLPGALLERHRALNWITRFEEAAWDEVTTPT